MTAPVVALVAAVSENGVIGRDGQLPWRLSTDLKTFRRLTMGKPVVMGRKTFQSLKKPLDGRDNIVVSRDPAFEAAGVSVVDSVADALVLARTLAATRGADEIAVIGGAEVFRIALPVAGRIYLTEVQATVAGDVAFPPFDRAEWREVRREALPKGEKDDHSASLVVLERTAPDIG